MRSLLRHRPSPALVVACIALAVALGGTSYAAIRLPANSVGTKQLKKNAVTSPKVKNNSITGADVNELSLGQVPSAASAVAATTATNAGHAANADHATSANSATTAGTANAAYSANHGSSIALPDSLATIGTLNIPAAGKYVVSAKFWAYNQSLTPNDHSDCTLGAPTGGGDSTDFDVDGSENDDEEVVVLELALEFTSPGQLVLRCSDNGQGNVLAFTTRITAVQVAQLTNTGF